MKALHIRRPSPFETRTEYRQREQRRLTPRQDEVLSLLRRGLSNKEIARTLNVAESTVKFHCIAIFRQLGVSNRTQAAIRAEEMAANGRPAVRRAVH